MSVILPPRTQGKGTSQILIHCDGANGQQQLFDFGRYGLPFANTGGITLDTSQKKFGTASILGANGAGFSISQSIQNRLLEFGGSDFTIDCWVFRTGTGAAEQVFIEAAGSWFFGFFQSTNLGFYTFVSGVPTFNIRSISFATGAWVHYAACRSGSNIRLFEGGIQVGANISIGASVLDAATFPFTVANNPVFNQPLVGNLDETRLIIGQALYTSNFTPPTQPFVS